MNSSSTASMNTSIESDINILNVLYRQIIIDLSQSLKDPYVLLIRKEIVLINNCDRQNAQISEHAKMRIMSFEVLIETIQSRIVSKVNYVMLKSHDLCYIATFERCHTEGYK